MENKVISLRKTNNLTSNVTYELDVTQYMFTWYVELYYANIHNHIQLFFVELYRITIHLIANGHTAY